MPSRTELLHIENDALVARAVSRVLKHKGFAVRSVASCTDARTVSARFRVGVFDIDLSDGNGVALAEELSRSGIVTHAVFFTASTDSELHLRALQTGPVVNKTLGVSGLIAALSSKLPANNVSAMTQVEAAMIAEQRAS